jgi:radical SAM superfamily enzyme YgiQ (UPF0313 family)
MKIILSTLNSKYVHTSLALRYLKYYCQDKYDAAIEEHSINDDIDFVLREIYRKSPDILALSTYIWNVEQILVLCKNIKSILPKTIIVLGGPEVSFGGQDLMEHNSFIDYIICGEGEKSFLKLLEHIIDEKGDINNIEGLIFRQGDTVKSNNCYALVENLNDIVFPYGQGDLDHVSGKILYYEASRGCPFNCSYCLSSTIKGVRHLDIERVKQELDFFVKNNAKLIKFVDRTFNCHKDFAKEIIGHIIKAGGVTTFHFEITASLIDDDFLDIVSVAPRGCIQFEIGVQTTNLDTLKAINRPISFDKIRDKISKLMEFNNIHIHLDLIAGLPQEDFQSFKKSFNDVYSLKPDKLQLGFLKLLKGTQIRNDAQGGGYVFRSQPPYQVLYNKWINFDEMMILTDVEDIVEKYYNSHRFEKTLEYLITKYSDAFDFYQHFAYYWIQMGYQKLSHNPKALYKILMEFSLGNDDVDGGLLNELLKFDYLMVTKAVELPKYINRVEGQEITNRIYEFYNDRHNIEKHLPNLMSLSSKQIYRTAHIETFNCNIDKIIKDNYTMSVRDQGEYYILFNYHDNKFTQWTEWSMIQI